eukprot:97580-Hanusia_phi.AAC.2
MFSSNRCPPCRPCQSCSTPCSASLTADRKKIFHVPALNQIHHGRQDHANDLHPSMRSKQRKKGRGDGGTRRAGGRGVGGDGEGWNL